jgi:hypothetical protein
VASMEKLGINANVYNKTFHTMDWKGQLSKPLLGGGEIKGLVMDHVAAEYERIVKYAQKGGIGYTRHATIQEMFEYLKKRN